MRLQERTTSANTLFMARIIFYRSDPILAYYQKATTSHSVNNSSTTACAR